ncbi:zinc iron permease [Scleroderma citrinum]
MSLPLAITEHLLRVIPVDDPSPAITVPPHPTTGIRARVLAILAIFVVSLFASSLPTLSKHVSSLRIPRIVFFVGKHFGTGVILATAFAHLLQDAFEALRDPIVLARWKIGKNTGLIVLASLLSIFLVEYISTSYVDGLQSYSSPSISPDSTPRPVSPDGDGNEPRRSQGKVPKITKLNGTSDVNSDLERSPLLNEGIPHALSCGNHEHGHKETRQHQHQHIPHTQQRHQQTSYGTTHIHHDIHDHPRTRTTSASNTHCHAHTHADVYASGAGSHMNGGAIVLEGHHRHEPRATHSAHHDRGPRLPALYVSEELRQGTVVSDAHGQEEYGDVHHGHHVHGLGEFGYGDAEKDVKIGEKRQIIGILVLQLGIMIHSFVIGLTLAITSGSEFASLLIAVVFHQLFEGLSLGIRIASLPSSSPCEPEVVPHATTSHDPAFHLHSHPESACIIPEEKRMSRFIAILKPTLACLFAITTPAGIWLGMLVFKEGADIAHMRLTQGLMSAISAGMLIYAACVEMLAADFVMDPTLWRSGWTRQGLAVGSLVLGVFAMGVIS